MSFNQHLRHHSVGIFGTAQDEQYPLIRSDRVLAILLHFSLPLLLPVVNLGRVMLTPLDLILPNAAIKLNYCQFWQQKYYFLKGDLQKFNAIEMYYFVCVIFVSSFFSLPWFYAWYVVSVLSWFLSTLRVPLEHELQTYKTKTTIEDQIADSRDRPPSLAAFIVQPLASNFHRTHHAYPAIPYHNLKLVRKCNISI